ARSGRERNAVRSRCVQSGRRCGHARAHGARAPVDPRPSCSAATGRGRQSRGGCLMELVIAVGIAVLTAAGVWLILRPRTFEVIIGVSLISYAVNLFIFGMGRLRVKAAPVIENTASIDPAAYADPVPQSLVLTAIVIGFAM